MTTPTEHKFRALATVLREHGGLRNEEAYLEALIADLPNHVREAEDQLAKVEAKIAEQ